EGLDRDRALGRRQRRLPLVADDLVRAPPRGRRRLHDGGRVGGHRPDRLRDRRSGPLHPLAQVAGTMSLGLCLAVATSIATALPVERFTLSWVHSVEKVSWEEDWRIDPVRHNLVLVESRLRGSGA